MAETGGSTGSPQSIADPQGWRDFLEVVREIAGCRGPVSAEVVALDHEGMMREAEVLRRIADNIAVKVPLTVDGLKTCKKLTSDGTMVNVTLCFSANQALLAAKAGATFVSPFLGRLDDIGQTGMELIADIRLIYDNYDFATQILAASIRHPIHVFEAAKLGADVMTAPPAVIRQLFNHPLTDKGIEAVLAVGRRLAADRLTDFAKAVGPAGAKSSRPDPRPMVASPTFLAAAKSCRGASASSAEGLQSVPPACKYRGGRAS